MKSERLHYHRSTKGVLGRTSFIVGAIFSLSVMAKAQVSDYAFSQSNASYSSITGTAILASGWDDDLATYNFPSGNFTFNGVAYNYVKVNSNGYVTFGSTTSQATSYSPISSTRGYAGSISAFGYDLVDNNSTVVATQSGGEIIVQWNNARRYSFGTITGDVLNWQIRLDQSTGVIRIVYGTCTATNATSRAVQVGLRGASNSDFNNRSSSSSWSGTTVGGSNAATVSSKNTIMPASGLTFTWSPSKDIGPTALALPTALSCFTNAQPVSVTIKNQGTNTLNFATSPVTVTANVTGAATATLSGTISTGTLTAGSTVNVPMSATLNMSAGGDYNFALSTSMSGDTDPSNDNAPDSRTSNAPSGVTATSSAATVCAGNTVNLFSTGTASAQTVISQDFNGTSTPTGWDTDNNSTGGTSTNRAKAAWTLRNDGYNYDFTFHSNDNSRFYMSNSDDPGSAITTITSLTSPTFSLVGMSSPSLTFYHYYRYNNTESANIQISTNGSTWTTIQSYNSTVGSASAFAAASISLNAYAGQATVQVRFLYNATWDYYWALDNFEVSAISAPSFSWTSTPSGFTSSVQNPTNVTVGANTIYKVTATSSGCSSTAQVTVNTIAPPNAGTNGALTICAGSTVTAPQLFAALGGTPNGGGSWSPALAGAGTYTYTVNATSPCAVNATAQVVVNEQAQPNAGSNGALVICAGSTVTAPQLFAELSGTPDAGGSWSPALAGAGTYTYTVNATAPCAVNATAQVVVNEQAQPDAGSNGALTICAGSTLTAPELFAELGGTPDAGGSWSPALAGAGTYTYTVNATAPCAVNATAQVVVSEQPQPNPGTNTSFVTCNGAAPFSMLGLLGAGAQSGGTWSGPSPVVGDLYDATIMDAGTYTYTVSATTPCAGSASASIAVSETGNQVILRIHMDSHADQTSWILMDGTSSVIATGGPYTAAQNNTQVDEMLCLSNANGSCYGLKLLDSFGDGLSGVGSWQLITASGKVLLGDAFTNGSSSPSPTPANPSYTQHSFCLPAGNTQIASQSCGHLDLTPNSKVYCTNAPGALSNQFEFSDPDAGFIRRITVNANSVRFSQMVTSPLTPGVKYFVRARNNGSGAIADAHFGGGCEVGMTSTLTCTELISAPTYGHSCGELRAFNTNNSFIYATPVVGATEYQFRISIPGEGYDQTFIRSTYILQLKWNASVAPPLVNGSTYNVQVNVKVGTVYSGFCGDICMITIDNSSNRPEARLLQTSSMATIWPNPARDGQVNLSIDGIQDADQKISVDIQDIYGKQVFTKEFGNSGEQFKTTIDLPDNIATGVYLVNVTVNGKSTVKRLSIIK